ncbi:hypothetical protein BLNAU_19706 [Blattamonas nauphoetae]|uniref:Uncharacterized protein n=1 Tax=Blattamonas nauphoetae TaxID=2049346 RepID=A0ABQ9X0Q6_9EUKA|nr:hypothetical protein BLNAU_19706 [Blattamonas nauphoetae]
MSTSHLSVSRSILLETSSLADVSLEEKESRIEYLLNKIREMQNEQERQKIETDEMLTKVLQVGSNLQHHCETLQKEKEDLVLEIEKLKGELGKAANKQESHQQEIVAIEQKNTMLLRTAEESILNPGQWKRVKRTGRVVVGGKVLGEGEWIDERTFHGDLDDDGEWLDPLVVIQEYSEENRCYKSIAQYVTAQLDKLVNGPSALSPEAYSKLGPEELMNRVNMIQKDLPLNQQLPQLHKQKYTPKVFPTTRASFGFEGNDRQDFADHSLRGSTTMRSSMMSFGNTKGTRRKERYRESLWQELMGDRAPITPRVRGFQTFRQSTNLSSRGGKSMVQEDSQVDQSPMNKINQLAPVQATAPSSLSVYFELPRTYTNDAKTVNLTECVETLSSFFNSSDALATTLPRTNNIPDLITLLKASPTCDTDALHSTIQDLLTAVKDYKFEASELTSLGAIAPLVSCLNVDSISPTTADALTVLRYLVADPSAFRELRLFKLPFRLVVLLEKIISLAYHTDSSKVGRRPSFQPSMGGGRRLSMTQPLNQQTNIGSIDDPFDRMHSSFAPGLDLHLSKHLRTPPLTPTSPSAFSELHAFESIAEKSQEVEQTTEAIILNILALLDTFLQMPPSENLSQSMRRSVTGIPPPSLLHQLSETSLIESLVLLFERSPSHHVRQMALYISTQFINIPSQRSRAIQCGLVKAVIQLLHDQSLEDDERALAFQCLSTFSVDADIRDDHAESILSVALSFLKSASPQLLCSIIRCLIHLCASAEARRSFVHNGGLKLLKAMLKTESDKMGGDNGSDANHIQAVLLVHFTQTLAMDTETENITKMAELDFLSDLLPFVVASDVVLTTDTLQTIEFLSYSPITLTKFQNSPTPFRSLRVLLGVNKTPTNQSLSTTQRHSQTPLDEYTLLPSQDTPLRPVALSLFGYFATHALPTLRVLIPACCCILVNDEENAPAALVVLRGAIGSGNIGQHAQILHYSLLRAMHLSANNAVHASSILSAISHAAEQYHAFREALKDNVSDLIEACIVSPIHALSSISHLLKHYRFLASDGIAKQCISFLTSSNPDVISAALSCLYSILADGKVCFQHSNLAPLLLQATNHPSISIRHLALECLEFLLQTECIVEKDMKDEVKSRLQVILQGNSTDLHRIVKRCLQHL